MNEMVVPDGWEIKRLGDHIGILSGFPFKSSSFTGDPSKIGLIRIRDLVRQELNTFYEGDYSQEYVVAKGDVLVGMDGDFIVVKWKIQDALLNQRICKIEQSENGFNVGFVHYTLIPELQKIHNVTTATTVKHLSVKDIREIRKLFPPLPEQQKIASILTSVDEVIEKTQSQINKLQDLKKGTMNELLTKGIGHTESKDSPVGKIPVEWEVLETSSLYKFKNGLNKEKDAFGTGQKIVNYMDVYKRPELSDFDLIGRVELSTSESERFSVSLGDVFFTRTSETPDEIGLSSVITNVSENVCFSGFELYPI